MPRPIAGRKQMGLDFRGGRRASLTFIGLSHTKHNDKKQAA